MTISLWHSWSVAERQILDEVLQSYQEIFPDVRFDVLYVPFDELLGKYETAAASGEGPDVVLAPGDWGARFYDESLVADLTGLASPDFLATISPAALQAVRYRGAMIGLPYRMDGIVMYRNTSIVGFTPQDFESLISLSRSATKAGVVGAYLERSFFYAAAHLYGAGGRLMDDNGSPAFNNAGGIEWLGLLKSFERAGLTEFNGNRDLELFKQGKAGIIFEGSWNRNVLADAIGARNLAIDPWPAAGSGHLSGFIRTENLYLNANVRGDENLAALQFMGFFLAPQVQAILTLAGHIPAVIGVETSDPLLQQSVLAFTAATAFPILPQAASYWDPLEEAMLSVFNEGVDPALALRHAHDRILARLP